MKNLIEKQLYAIQIADYLEQNNSIIFNLSLSSKENCIRFSSPVLESIVPRSKKPVGFWGNGYFLMYEIYNNDDNTVLTCSTSIKSAPKETKEKIIHLCKSCGIKADVESDELYLLKKWVFDQPFIDYALSIAKTKSLIENDVINFEKELSNWEKDHDYIIDTSKYEKKPEEISEESFWEGFVIKSETVKYERNPKARRKCIEYHGAYCHVCGFDFGKTYGSKYKNIIEVHHITPLHTIKKGYEVDPIKDLIPLCSNCHAIVHSKKDGYYSIEEVISLIKNNRG